MNTLHFKGFALTLNFGKYANGQNKLQLMDSKNGMSFAEASVPAPMELLDDEIAIKDYSENEGILQLLIDNDILTVTDRFWKTGFVTIPICQLFRPEETEQELEYPQ